MPVFQFVAILMATLFSGAALYVSLVEHPARMECGTELAATVFGPSYRRAAVMQAILALAATIAGIRAWFPDTRLGWFLTNKRLLDSKLDRTSEAARRPLHRWGTLHWVRSVLGLAASVVFLWLVLSSSTKP